MKRKLNLPSLSTARRIAVDLETKDEGLAAGRGPGGVFGMGYILGVAISTGDFSTYISLNHPDTDNYPEAPVLAWLRKELGRKNQMKVGSNILYDLEWLRAYDVEVVGPLFDTHVAEPLIDENLRKYNLEDMSKKYLPKKDWKQTEDIAEVVERVLGKTKGDPRAHLWQLPGRLVESYAVADAQASLLISYEQEKVIAEQGLERVFDVEMRLVPMLLDMRFKGVRINVKGIDKVRNQMLAQRAEEEKQLLHIAGMQVNVNASDSVAKAFDAAGIPYPTTKTGRPSFVKEWLDAHPAPLAHAILALRKSEKLLGTFIDGHIMSNLHGDRIHCSFHQLRSDDSGTVSGRFSSSNPNLQQIPSRDKVYAPMIRGLFIPSPGCFWWKNDWSQVEYRLIVHYAAVQGLPKAGNARAAYLEDPLTDFHQWAADLMKRERRFAKDINFGLAYNMGKTKLARSLNLSEDEADELFGIYHTEVPFMRGLSRAISRVAKTRGYIKTLLGRRRRFDLYEPAGTWNSKAIVPLPYEEALEQFGAPVQRSHTYKAMNSVIQGSAADLMKLAMVECNASGVFDVLGTPSLTVHDELDGDCPKTKAGKEALREVKHIMETCYPLEVPVLCDSEIGKSWGDLKAFK